MGFPRHSGFTLIELLVVIAVLGILTVAAVASYGSSAVKTRRGSAQACLLEASQAMERAYTLNMTYAGVAYPDLACNAELSDYYSFGFQGAPDADEYALQAVPRGAQLSGDTACATMTLDQIGIKTESGTASGPGDCW